jgi:hypothetical protein
MLCITYQEFAFQEQINTAGYFIISLPSKNFILAFCRIKISHDSVNREEDQLDHINSFLHCHFVKRVV